MKTIATIPIACCICDDEPLPATQRVVLADRLKALADPTRIGIVNRLACSEELCVCDLTEAFELSQPTISHHLRILREAGLVAASRRGTWAYYRLNRDAVGELSAALAA
jgi:ArsR family transcriptional regulator, arsenate/arsenite/antimonite-responsive transcriptional repressor